MITDGEEPTTLQTLLSQTAAGRKILERLTGDSVLLGKFLPGLMKPLKKIGKVTKYITGTAAKAIGAAFGIPPAAIDALAKIDPTAHTALLDKLSEAKLPKLPQKGKGGQLPATTEPPTGKIKPLYFAIGAGGLAAVILIFAITAKKRKRG